jgi:hypothetical protein
MAEIMFGARALLVLLLAITWSSAAASQGADASLVAKGATYYLSPSGDDSNPGTTPDRPWRSFAKVLNSSKPLRPGDAVVLLDGTYTPQTTGLPHVDCRPDGNAPSGAPGRPIVLRAQNERQAFLESDAHAAGLTIEGCSWWHVEGLRAASRDADAPQLGGFPVRLSRVDHVTLKRLLGSHNNRRQNTHVFAIEDSTNVLLEECEAYFFHRHAFSIWRSRFVTIRRCYANSMRYGERGCCSSIDNRAYGDEAFSLYGTSDSIVENSISENEANGFQIHGIGNAIDPSGSGGRNNRILGSVSFGDSVPLLVSSRMVDGTYHNAEGNEIRDFVAANMRGAGMYVRGAAGTLVENATLYGSSGLGGLVADGGDPGLGGSCGPSNPDACSLIARYVLSLDHGNGYGFLVSGFENWLIEWSNASGNRVDYGSPEPPEDDAGHIRYSRAVDAPEIGLGGEQCLIRVPQGSALKGAANGDRDIGATIVHRYHDGKLTRLPLWDPATGAFPCGAVVAGINDGPIRCTNVHERLNVSAHGCHLQASAMSEPSPEAGDDEGDAGPRGNRQAFRERHGHSDRAE